MKRGIINDFLPLNSDRLWTTDYYVAIWGDNIEELIKQISPRIIKNEYDYIKLGFIAIQTSYSLTQLSDNSEPVITNYETQISDMIYFKNVLLWPDAVDIVNKAN